MRKRIVFIMTTVCALLITGCGASNSEEDPAGTDNQIKVTYVEMLNRQMQRKIYQQMVLLTIRQRLW